MPRLLSKAEVLAYAREIKRERPSITTEELRQFLQARFIYGVDPLAQAHAQGLTIGAIDNPWDWLAGLLAIARGISRLMNEDSGGVSEIIGGVLIIVQQ